MREAIKYTRAAVQLIRNGATAADLGWSSSMYGSVCKTHGIAQTPDRIETIKPETAPRVKLAAQISFDDRVSQLMRGSIAVSLRKGEAMAFAKLFEQWKSDPDAWVRAVDLLELKDKSRANGHRVLSAFNGRLTPLRMWLESKGGRGYRLRVDA